MSIDVSGNSVLGVLGLTPRDVKLALRDGTVQLLPGYPKIPDVHSVFQRNRIRSSFPIVSRYLKGGRTVTQLAEEFKVTHQRISQILNLGIRFMIEAGHIVATRRNGDGVSQG